MSMLHSKLYANCDQIIKRRQMLPTMLLTTKMTPEVVEMESEVKLYYSEVQKKSRRSNETRTGEREEETMKITQKAE